MLCLFCTFVTKRAEENRKVENKYFKYYLSESIKMFNVEINIKLNVNRDPANVYHGHLNIMRIKKMPSKADFIPKTLRIPLCYPKSEMKLIPAFYFLILDDK